MTERIEVAVGIVFNREGKVLVGQRVVKDRYYAKWEFPGGKLEQGETIDQALRREFKEEVGIDLGVSNEFMLIEHDYPDRHVRLHVRTVKDFSGKARPLEGQALNWVAVCDLSELDFLQGNQGVIEELQKIDQLLKSSSEASSNDVLQC